MHRSSLAITLLLALSVAACGSDGGSSSSSSPTTTVDLTTTTTSLAPAATTTTAATTTLATTTTATPTTLPPTTVAPAPSPCTAAGLGLSAEPTDGAMGSVYTPIDFVNNGSTACTLSTHVVLSFLDSGGTIVGTSVATPEAAGPGILTLAPMETRQSFIRYSQPGNMGCAPISTDTTAQLTVNQTEKLTLPPTPWPLCPDQLAEQISLGDLAVANP